MLEPVVAAGWSEADGAVADCDAQALCSLAADAYRGLGLGMPAVGRLTIPGGHLPALEVALVRIREYKSGSPVDGVQVEADVMHHADAAEVLAQVAALRPQHRLDEIVRAKLRQPHLKLRPNKGIYESNLHPSRTSEIQESRITKTGESVEH